MTPTRVEMMIFLRICCKLRVAFLPPLKDALKGTTTQVQLSSDRQMSPANCL